MNDIDWLDDQPADKRLALYLEEALAGDDFDARVAKLASELGYVRSQTVKGWISGSGKVPLKALTPIALFIGRDVCQLMPLWIAQEMKAEDEDRLYQASKRMVSVWEWGLIAVARDIYAGDDD